MRAEGTGQEERETDVEEAVRRRGRGQWRCGGGQLWGSFCVSTKRVAPVGGGPHLTALHWWPFHVIIEDCTSFINCSTFIFLLDFYLLNTYM